MSNPSSSPRVPAINIFGVDDTPALLSSDLLCNLYDMVPEDPSLYSPCSRSLPSEYNHNPFSNASSDLDDIPELSHLNTTISQPFFTGTALSAPYSIIRQENGTTVSPDGGLSPFDSSFPSPTSSFASSLSPASFYDPLTLSDNESAVSPSPATPDQPFRWPTPQTFNNQSSDSLVLHPSLLLDTFPNDSIFPERALGRHPTHRRSRSSLSARCEPVASKAMLEANSRRRRHPPQFQCEDCEQTFTALFSLKRHQQSHTGERPFACSIPGCSQRFFNSSDCKRHEKSKKRHKEFMMQ